MERSEKKQIRNTFIIQAIKQVLSFIIGVFLLRLIVPDYFGLIAMIVPIVGFLRLFHSFGTTNSIIAKKDLTKVGFSTLFWWKVGFSSLLALLFILSTPLLVLFYEETRLGIVILCFAISSIFISIGDIFYGLQYKRKNYLFIAKVEGISTIISGIISIYLALKGYALEALLIKEIVYALLVFSTLGIVSERIPTFKFEFSTIKSHISYGTNIVKSSLASWLSRSIDDIIIGKHYKSAALGVYSKSYSLLVLPTSFLVSTVLKIGLPIMSKTKTDEEAIDKFKSITRLLLLISGPFGLILFFTCESFVIDVFGAEWENMVQLIKVFSILSIFQILGPLDNLLYQGRDRSKALLRSSLILNAILILFIVFGFVFTDDINGIASSYAIGSATTYVVGQFFLAEYFKSSFKALLKNLLIPTMAIILTFVFISFIKAFYGELLSSNYIFILIVPATFIFLLLLLNRNELKNAWFLIKDFI